MSKSNRVKCGDGNNHMANEGDKPLSVNSELPKKKLAPPLPEKPKRTLSSAEHETKVKTCLVSSNDWRGSSNKKEEEILQLYLTGLFSDCTFRIGKGTGNAVDFKCHTLILTTSSSVFEELFKDKPQNFTFYFKHMTPTAFDLTMRFVYGNRLIFPSVEIGVEMCRAAYKWNLPRLAEAADMYLEKNICPSNVLLAFQMYRELGNTTKAAIFLKVIQKDMDKVLKSKYWSQASKHTIFDVLKCFNKVAFHTVSAIEIYNYLVSWGRNQVDVDQVSNDDAVYHKIKSLLPLINFGNLTAREFAELSSIDGIMSHHEKLDVLVKLVMKI